MGLPFNFYEQKGHKTMANTKENKQELNKAIYEDLYKKGMSPAEVASKYESTVASVKQRAVVYRRETWKDILRKSDGHPTVDEALAFWLPAKAAGSITRTLHLNDIQFVEDLDGYTKENITTIHGIGEKYGAAILEMLMHIKSFKFGTK